MDDKTNPVANLVASPAVSPSPETNSDDKFLERVERAKELQAARKAKRFQELADKPVYTSQDFTFVTLP